MKVKKQMTIDDLAVTVNDLTVIVKKGFQDADRKMATNDMLKNMVTKDMIVNVATKDMLKNLATKDMLTNVATKDMLTNVATKDMLKNLATKDMVKTTIDDFALMVQKGFQSTTAEIKGVEVRLEAKIGGLREEMNENFGRIEKLILVDHKRRIERLETEMRDLKDLFAMK